MKTIKNEEMYLSKIDMDQEFTSAELDDLYFNFCEDYEDMDSILNEYKFLIKLKDRYFIIYGCDEAYEGDPIFTFDEQVPTEVFLNQELQTSKTVTIITTTKTFNDAFNRIGFKYEENKSYVHD